MLKGTLINYNFKSVSLGGKRSRQSSLLVQAVLDALVVTHAWSELGSLDDVVVVAHSLDLELVGVLDVVLGALLSTETREDDTR